MPHSHWQGNPDVHVILRGGGKGPNYAAEYVREYAEKIGKAGLPQKLMVSIEAFCIQSSSQVHWLARSTAATAIAANNIVSKSKSGRTS
jgi:3-deoxy-7-phosphoheptulonate synthase